MIQGDLNHYILFPINQLFSNISMHENHLVGLGAPGWLS